jgi:hypothetical protein
MSDLVLLSITIYGMAIVISFLVAALIKGIVVALPLARRRDGTRGRPQPLPAVVVPGEHVAVVGPSHIIHIEDRGRAAVWTAEGRMIHQTSHAVTRTRKP